MIQFLNKHHILLSQIGSFLAIGSVVGLIWITKSIYTIKNDKFLDELIEKADRRIVE